MFKRQRMRQNLKWVAPLFIACMLLVLTGMLLVLTGMRLEKGDFIGTAIMGMVGYIALIATFNWFYRIKREQEDGD